MFNVLLVIKDTFLVGDVTTLDYGMKNSVPVWGILIIVDAILVYLWFMLHSAASGIAEKYIRRINETLIISHDYIVYEYQDLVGSNSDDRVVIKVPVSRIDTVLIDDTVSKIVIVGDICSVYYDNYSNRKTQEHKKGSLVLFDYFTPELIVFLKENFSKKVTVM